MTKRAAEANVSLVAARKYEMARPLQFDLQQAYQQQIRSVLSQLATIEVPMFRVTMIADAGTIDRCQITYDKELLLGEAGEEQCANACARLCSDNDATEFNALLNRLEALRVHYSSDSTRMRFVNEAHYFAMQQELTDPENNLMAGHDPIRYQHYNNTFRFFRPAECLSERALAYILCGEETLKKFEDSLKLLRWWYSTFSGSIGVADCPSAPQFS